MAFFNSLARRMSEKTKLTVIVLFPLLVSLLIIYFFEFHYPRSLGYYVKDYRLDIFPGDKGINVSETFVYHFDEPRYHEIFRSFGKDSVISSVQILNVSCPGMIYNEHTLQFGEVSCFSTEPLRGEKVFRITYFIPRAYICGDDGRVINWLVFDSFSAPIKKARVNINAEAYEVYPRNPFTGRISLMPNSAMQVAAFVRGKGGCFARVESARDFFKSVAFKLRFYSLFYSLRFLFYLFPPVFGTYFLISVYRKYGVDRDPVGAPEVLHYPPQDLKPHIFDFLYGEKIGALEDNVIEAVILDLARRGCVRIEDKKLVIFDRPCDLDIFESRILNFYKKYAERVNGTFVFYPEKFEEKLSDRSFASKVSSELMALKQPTFEMEEELKKVFDRKGSDTVKYFALALVIIPYFLGFFGPMFLPNLAHSLVTGIFYTILVVSSFYGLFLLLFLEIFDDFVFGRYSEEGRKNKALWDAFINLLSDYSLIEKYAPRDLDMWGRWLVYATVVGEADNVLKAMKKFKVKVPNIETTRVPHFYAYVSSISSSRSFSGAGGVGFGGGSGGAR